jgi:hypothetical protein
VLEEERVGLVEPEELLRLTEPERVPTMAPDEFMRVDTRPKPVGLVRPTPRAPPVVRLENLVGRAAGL